ncbi:MAG: deoxyribodipyrimidine photo-lyase [Paludibacter sp.]|nr:deoxyribodipyrimidine photo-lyase [Paludibacter sp.]
MNKKNNSVVVFWFRRDLRLEDNAGLYNALQSGYPVLPLFIFDSEILSQIENKYDRRVDFIHQILMHILTQLKKHGSSMCVKFGKPTDIFNQLTKDYDVKSVYTNRDYETYALERDKEISLLLKAKNIEFLTFKDQVIFEYNEVLKSNDEPYTVFTPYSKTWKQKLSESNYKNYQSENELKNFIQDDNKVVPTLGEIGFEKTDLVFRLPIINTELIKNYENTRNTPSIEGSSKMSVHLRFGTISIRKLVSYALKNSEIWLNELIWREFFMTILVQFPYVENAPFKKQYDFIQWRNNEKEFTDWCEGKTGYPIVDAGMRQLNETGWMHNRVRMIVAGFLTKHLLIDWRWGEAYFAQKLIDYDLSANNGNWQWAAGCGCDAAPYFRIFNPAEQTKKFDTDLLYIRRWVKDLDSTDYPQPIVEHTFARNRALEVYQRGLMDSRF